ncbi:hypothetical protein LTR84_011066 [Exophiala bonariae]|uniref:MOSC domain-containing protein n=1 Tax=Exophiala bonariae TaxID=1690606 RepID=A0AAV9NI46_9EURO|nr:hypothetical protein LTR84_011066 [Exophiala bonariae]
MEVAAVSCGLPQWIDINGTRTRTSIIHTIVDRITLKTGRTVEDNATAVHDAPVYAFFTHHYNYWRHKLGVKEEDWNWGHWGENITFKTDEYMDETQFNLGDVWKVGDEVLLQVCGARVPCFKLAWRCGQNDKWLKELADTGFSGVYLRIINGGSIVPGDRAELMRKVDSSPTVAQISQLAFDTRLETKNTLNLMVKEPDLLPMNKGGFLRTLSRFHDDEMLGKNHWKGWRTFRATKVIKHSHDIKSFYLQPVDKEPLGTYLPGQFLTVRLPNGLLRNWSISDWPDHDDPKYYRLTIKNIGETSNWMHTRCTSETKLFIRAPAGRFTLDWSPVFPLRQVYISAGIGVTPIVAMLKAHLKHYTMQRAPAVWIHVARDESGFPQEFLAEVLRAYDNELRKKKILEIHVVYTKAADPSVGQAHDGPTSRQSRSPIEDSNVMTRLEEVEVNSGLVSSSDSSSEVELKKSPILSSTASSLGDRSPNIGSSSLSDVLSFDEDNATNNIYSQGTALEEKLLKVTHGRRVGRDFLSNLLSSTYYFNPLQITPIEVPGPSTTTVYICGPSSFEEDMKSYLRDVGIPESLLRSESFSSTDSLEAAATSISKSSVTFRKSTLTADWLAPKTEGLIARSLTLLEFAESLGLEPNFGCRAGQCGSCSVKLLSGRVHGGLQPDGSVLMCQSRPASELLELEL